MEKDADGYFNLKEEHTAKINPFEKTKLAKNPMRLWADKAYVQLCDAVKRDGFEAVDKADEKEIDVRLKWLGLFHRRKQAYGTFMMRLKVPNGVCTAEQVRYLGQMIGKYGDDGCADITNRMNWQLRGIKLEDVPDIFENLERLGMTTVQSGMDNVRNIIGNPLAGVDAEEIVDTLPISDAIQDYIINGVGTERGRPKGGPHAAGNLEVANLPRKFNVSVVGTHDVFEHPHINDISYVPAMKDGRAGFNVVVAGYLSSGRVFQSIPLDAWVAEDDVVGVLHGVLTTFRDYGARSNRQKCRLVWCIEDMGGIEAFRAEVEKRTPSGSLKRAGESRLDPSRTRRRLFGVNAQKQAGLNWVGCAVPSGRMTPDDMVEVARLAEEYGDGDVRLTAEQNFVLSGVPDDKVDALLAEPLLAKFSTNPGPVMEGMVSCTGNQFCGFAMVETKMNAKRLSEELEASMDFVKPVRMYWTGCPNRCGQPELGDIGFLGTTTMKDGKKVEAVDILMGGVIGQEHALGETVQSGVPIEDLLPAVQELCEKHFGATMRPAAA